MDFRPEVEQDKEVDTTPGAQEGQDGGRRRRGKGGVGGGVDRGVEGEEGEEGEAAVQQSLFSGSGVTEGGEERDSCVPLLVLGEGLETVSHS